MNNRAVGFGGAQNGRDYEEQSEKANSRTALRLPKEQRTNGFHNNELRFPRISGQEENLGSC
jgi:hypothetical protein